MEQRQLLVVVNILSMLMNLENIWRGNGMMTDKTKTPQKIFLQENYGKQEYGIEQDGNIRGMVRYFRCDKDYNKIKGVLAIALMDYLDNNRPEGKMCLSNGECKNIDDAFALGDWDMIFRYIEKYIKK